MKQSEKFLSRILFFILSLLVTAIVAPPSFARGGCFAGDVQILTPNGSVPISSLKSGDTITTYNFSTKTQETGVIGTVLTYSEPHYYLLNQTTRVTE